MAILKRNIWTLFFILFLGGLFAFCLFSFNEWKNIHAKHLFAQESTVNLVASSMHSLFVTEEMMLDILGKELIKDESYKTLISSPYILDNVLALNPSLVSFGLALPNGKMTFVSGNVNTALLPNLLEREVSRDSFIHALNSHKMVLGRSYFFEPVQDWVIPIRKAIRGKDGEVLAVMTAGMRLEGTAKLLNDELIAGNYNTLALLRNFDHFIQFESITQRNLQDVYAKPMDAKFWEQIEQQLVHKYKRSLESIKESEGIYSYESKDYNNQEVQAVLKYNKRYEIWIFSTILKSHIISEFFSELFISSLIFLATQVVLYILFRYIAEAEAKRRDELIFQATHDPLTKLPNRIYLKSNIEKWIHKGSKPFSLLYIDLDRFKNINDSFGHQSGDYVLIDLAKRLQSVAMQGSMVIRQGGDEFIILLLCTDDIKLQNYAQNIIDMISKPYFLQELSFIIGASIGIAKYPEHGESLDKLLFSADIAMYEAKKHKNCAYMFANTMQEGYLHKVLLEQSLRTAIEKDALYMVYQPQVNEHGDPYGVEALIRWNDPQYGFISPAQFIPIAEASGLMPKLGNFIIKKVLHEMKQLQETLGYTIRVSINISVSQFMEANFLDNLCKELDSSGIQPSSVTLEITESLLIEDKNYILTILNKIHAMGISISMDDFGTGYSSLSMLRLLPIDELKIDKSFVDTILEDVISHKMIRNIISIGKNLEMSVLAEGVETLEQETLLLSFGCDHFQGYYHAKPMDIHSLKQFFSQSHT